MHVSIRVVLGAVLVGAGLLAAGCGGSPAPTHPVATNDVTFTVSGKGTADITWPGAARPVHTALPWRATAKEPTARSLNLGVVLDQNGGMATCAISVNGHPVGSSLAQGRFGRANCHGPATAQSDD